MIMNMEDPLLFLGKQADTEIIKKLLGDIELDEYVSIKRGETDVYLPNHKKGICLLFESERYIHSKYGKTLPSEAPLLTAIFMYGRNHEEFSEFTGKLLNGLLLSDSRETVRGKLGDSKKYNPESESETWNFPSGLKFFVDYDPDRNGILLAQLSTA